MERPRKYISRTNINTDRVFLDIRSRKDVERYFNAAQNMLFHFEKRMHPSEMVRDDFDSLYEDMANIEVALSKIIQLRSARTFVNDRQYSEEEIVALFEKYHSLDEQVQTLHQIWLSRD